MPLCKYPTFCPWPNLSSGFCRNATIAICIPNWISFAIGLKVVVNFIVFLVFSTFKILEEVCLFAFFFCFFSNIFFFLLLLIQEEEF
jgi:hypothetical protein